MKKIVSLLSSLTHVFRFTSIFLADAVIDTVMTAGTTHFFSNKPVHDEDLTTILQAGLATAGAVEQQPWFFAVLTDQEMMSWIADTGFGTSDCAALEGMNADIRSETLSANDAETTSGSMSIGDSPAAIIIFMDEAEKSPNASFDCGLAAQNMYITAVSLGYGVRIVSFPARILDREKHDALCQQLGIDPSLQAVAVLLIGYPDGGIDKVAGGTAGNKRAEKAFICR